MRLILGLIVWVMDFWILLLNWVWFHYVSCALIHLNPYIPVISYHEDFTWILCLGQEVLQEIDLIIGVDVIIIDGNFGHYCASPTLSELVYCVAHTYILLSPHMEWVTCIFFPATALIGLNLLHTSDFMQFYRHSKKHLKGKILVVLNVGTLL